MMIGRRGVLFVYVDPLLHHVRVERDVRCCEQVGVFLRRSAAYVVNSDTSAVRHDDLARMHAERAVPRLLRAVVP